MGLFQKQPISVDTQLYTLGRQQTKLIVGLGNTGDKYQKNRHNVGFMSVDYLARKWQCQFQTKKELHAEVAETVIGDSKVVLIKPSTMMNLSGNAVQAVQNYFHIENQNTLVIHDELDVHFGTLRLRNEGGSAGNNGVQSIIERCGGDFNRVRVGIGPKTPEKMDSADFVLQDFLAKEQGHFDELFKEIESICQEFVYTSGALAHDTRIFTS